MLKRIGLSAAALLAALVVVVQPPTAAAQNRDFNSRNSYNNNQPNAQSNAQRNEYGSNDRSQNSYAHNRQPNGYVNAPEHSVRVSQQYSGRTGRNPRLTGNGWSTQGWGDRDRNSQQYRRSEDSDGYNSDRR